MSSPAKARMASTESHSDKVMNSVWLLPSCRSSHAPRLPGVWPYSAKPVALMYSAYSSASAPGREPPRRARSCLLGSLGQEVDDDPGIEASVAGAGQHGQLRVGHSPVEGEGVLDGDLLVAVADHDERRAGVAGEVGDGEGGLLAVHPVQLGLHDREVV